MPLWNCNIKKLGASDYLITRNRATKKFIFFGKTTQIEEQFRGNCTVWYKCCPNVKRCSTSLESWLCEVWQEAKWEEQDKFNKLTQTSKEK